MGMFSFDTSALERNMRKLLAANKQDKKKAMGAVAQYLEGEVKDSTPVDEGELTADVRGSVQEDGGVTGAVICIPANAPSSSYAIPMHVNDYVLGPNSLAKQAKTGKPVGKNYILNPIDNGHGRIGEIIVGTLKR